MRGLITTLDSSHEELLDKVKKVPLLSDFDYVNYATTESSYVIDGDGPHVALLDLGCKYSIISSLEELNCKITVLPAYTSPEEILSLNPDGLMLSNGPGDPKSVPYAAETVKYLTGKLPVFGICLGHQVIALALGGDTYRLKFGHRGTNHPVKNLKTGKVHITSQNHGFAVKKESLDNNSIEITHININDFTVEGIKHKELPVFSVHFHPEGCPGPYDSVELFGEFLSTIKNTPGGHLKPFPTSL